MKETKGNCIEIDIINENCVKILARCHKPSDERQIDSKDSIFQISNNNSLMLSNTLSSVNTIRISKNSLVGSMWNGTTDQQNKETPKKNEKTENIKKNKANILIYESSKSNSSEIKKQSKFQNLKLEIAKINNFISTNQSNNEDEEQSDDRNNSNLCSQSVIYLSKNEDVNKLEISNKSIFFTPSTICNYYQPSMYLDNSLCIEDSKRKNKNLDDLLMNDDIIPKTIYMDVASSKLTPPQIRYTRLQLQSCEKNEKLKQNSNNLIILKEKAVINEENSDNKIQVKINFEENDSNNFTLHNIDNDIIIDKNDLNIKKKEFQTFHDLVKEIRKELVLNISSLDDDNSNNNIINIDGEDKTKNSSNFYIKNLGLNFCEMKINNNELSNISHHNNFNKNEIINVIPESKLNLNENTLQLRKNCLSCISEISLNIKPENKLIKNKNISECNFIIQKPDSISISLEEKKLFNPKTNSKQKTYISSLSKNKLLKKTYSRPDNCVIDSYNKLINKNFSSRLKINSGKKIEKPTHTHNSSHNKSPDNLKRTISRQKHKSTHDIINTTKNKILKSILMNFVGNYIEKQPEANNEVSGKNANKTVISPTNVQTTNATQNSNQKINTTASGQDSERNNKGNINCGIISSKKKEYLDLVKLLSTNENNHNRNKQKTPDINQRMNSKGKTYEVTINLDHPNTERIAKNPETGKKQLTINMSQNDSKSNSLSKKDSNPTNTTFKKINSNKSILPPGLIKMKSGRCEIKNNKKISIHSNIPVSNCPQTVKNNKKNLVSELVNQQKNISLSNKNNKVFININNKAIMSNNNANPVDINNNYNQNSNLKNPPENTINRDNNKFFKNENLTSSTKNKTNFVKIINNFSNYTKIKKENSKGKENAYNLNNQSFEKYKRQITSSKIKISGGDEDSVTIDEIEHIIN